MTTIVTRAGKGSPLTHTEVDTNFTNLNTAKLETAAIPLGTAAAPSISFLSDANTGIYSPEADTLAFVTAGSNRVHITSGGLVGIGTSSPGSLLSVASSSTTAYSATAFNNSRLYLSGGSATGAYNSIGFTNSSQSEGLIGFVQNVSGYGDFVVQGYHGGYAEKLRVTSAGLVGIGTNASNANGGVLQLSGGITFPSTAVAATDVNTLDDYEEGTWTPNQGSGLTVVGAFSSIGRYTKIGNVVTIWGDVTGATSIAVSAIGFITTNIPFNLDFNAVGANGVATGFWSASNSVIHISVGNTTSIYAAQAISGTSTIGFTITYRV